MLPGAARHFVPAASTTPGLPPALRQRLPMAWETESADEQQSSPLPTSQISPAPQGRAGAGGHSGYCWQRLLRRGWSVLRQSSDPDAKDVASITPATEEAIRLRLRSRGRQPAAGHSVAATAVRYQSRC